MYTSNPLLLVTPPSQACSAERFFVVADPPPYGFALGLVYHGNSTANATVTADTAAITKAYPKLLPSDSASKFDSTELWCKSSPHNGIMLDVDHTVLSVIRAFHACWSLISTF